MVDTIEKILIIIAEIEKIAQFRLKNDAQTRGIFEEGNKRVGFKKVFACNNSHTHIDQNQEINEIHYIQINSASHMWLGGDYILTGRYSESLDNYYPYIRYTAPYKDSIYAFVEITDKDIIIEGKLSEFAGPHPKDMGYKSYDNPSANITNKKLGV